MAGHTCKVIQLDGAVKVTVLRAVLAERLAGAPQLTMRLGGRPDAPTWVADAEFSTDVHVVDATGTVRLDEHGLCGAVARLFEQRLDRRRPLWRIDLVGPLAGGGSVLVWRLHHALADGATSSRLAGELLWDRPGESSIAQMPTPRGGVASRRVDLVGLVWREFAPSPFPSPFDGQISATRQVAFATVALAPLRHAARVLAEATVNDAVLSITAGALRRWLVARGERAHNLRVKVPVSLHHDGDRLANRDSSFSLLLPLEQADALERLRAVRAATRLRKSRHDALVLDDLSRRLTRLAPGSGAGFQLPTGPRAFALNVSNVRGPVQPVSVLGVPVRSMHSLAEIRPRHALRIAVISYADQLNIGLCAEPRIVPDLTTMTTGIQAEAAELLTAARP